jgi:hypothetical protein
MMNVCPNRTMPAVWPQQCIQMWYKTERHNLRTVTCLYDYGQTSVFDHNQLFF